MSGFPNLESGVMGLSVKIRVSYERPEELEQVRERLADMVRSCKESRNRDGKYRKAYLELKEDRDKGGGKIQTPFLSP